MGSQSIKIPPRQHLLHTKIVGDPAGGAGRLAQGLAGAGTGGGASGPPRRRRRRDQFLAIRPRYSISPFSFT